jgi:hypothetical protein
MTHSTGHSQLRSALLLAIGFAATAFSGTKSRATVILPNVPAGTSYEILFVTLDTTQATSTNISDYNAFVTNEANQSPALEELKASHPSLTWQAVASTAAVNAIVNAPDNGVAVYNTQGIELATAATGIYNGGLLNAVQYNQFGNTESGLTYIDAWTGTNASGGGVLGEQLGSTYPVEGYYTSSAGWIDEGNDADGFGINTDYYPLYALSSPITVPEPATITLLGSALLTVAGMRLVRRRSRV